jgi:hypothetical protein
MEMTAIARIVLPISTSTSVKAWRADEYLNLMFQPRAGGLHPFHPSSARLAGWQNQVDRVGRSLLNIYIGRISIFSIRAELIF